MDKTFEEVIWTSKCVKYLKELYFFKDNKYFIEGTSHRFYIKNSSTKDWARRMAKEYNQQEKYNLEKDLREKRKGQMSNGTLYSSSRFVAELFAKLENRKKLLNYLGIEDKNFKWYLEYRMPIAGLDRRHPPQLDLVAENDNYLIAIECKMKEIYSNHYNDFKKSYKDKGFIKEFKLKEVDGAKSGYIRTEIIGPKHRYCNFYYKQQICHLLGMRDKKKIKGYENKEFIFLNLVFNPKLAGISEKEILDDFNDYIRNENEVMDILSKHFDKNGIDYKGLIDQSLSKRLIKD